MEFVIADCNKKEIGIAPRRARIDIDVGNDNDFEIKVHHSVNGLFSAGGYIYAPGTEYGGKLGDPVSDTSSGAVTWSGDTFRGMLNKKVVEPPSGSDYLVLSGDLIECVADLFGNAFGSLFSVSTVEAGVSVTNYKVKRYCTLADALESLLDDCNYHLKLTCNNSSESFVVDVSVEENQTIEDQVEFSQDSNFNFKIKKVTNVYTHMIVCGKGDLQDRLILYYSWNNGNPAEVSEIPEGEEHTVYIYENTSYENVTSLRKEIKSKFKEINGSDSQTMTVKKQIDINVGDYVSGRDYITGMTITEQVTGKIIKQDNEKMTITYSIGGK